MAFSFVVGAVASACTASAQPSLSINTIQQNQFQVSWPASEAGYRLEQASSLGPQALWSPAVPSPAQNGDRLVVSITGGATLQFFRLRMNAFYVVYGRTDGTNGTIWLATSDGRFDQQIGTGFQPRLSPDGQTLAFRRAPNPGAVNVANIYLRDMITGQERLLHQYAGGILNSFDWRADGKHVIYDEGASIYQLAVDGLSGPQSLLQSIDPVGWDDGPAADPVSDYFAFWNERSGNADAGIHTANATGGDRTLVTGTGVDDGWEAWSPDGAWLSFWRNGTTDHGYYKIRSSGGELTPLVPGSEQYTTSPAIWAPDGRTLYAPLKTANGLHQLFAIPASGQGNPVRVPVHDGDDVIWVGSVQVTPLALAGYRPQTGTHPLNLYNEVSAQFARPLDPASITPASFRLISAGADGLFGTGDDRVVNGKFAPRANNFSWALVPDSPLTEGKYRVDLAGSLRDVTGVLLGTPFSWTFEVKKLDFFIAYGRTAQPDGTIWLLKDDGSVDQQVTTGERPVLSQNGRGMLFMRGAGNANYSRGNLYFRDLVTGQEVLKYDVRGDYLVGFDWRDGTNDVVFDWSCQIYDIDSQNVVRSLVSGNCYDDAPAVQPFEAKIAFHSSSGLVLADKTGANRNGIANTVPGDYYPQWSPDGEWLSFFRSSQTNVFIIRPDGSDLTQLTFSSGSPDDSFVVAPAPWRPDGAGVYSVGFVQGTQGIYFIPSDGIGITELKKSSPDRNLDTVGSVIPVAPGSKPGDN